MSAMRDNYNFYKRHKPKLLSKYEGKHVVIKDKKVISAYDDHRSAVSNTVKMHKLGTFLVKQVLEEDIPAIVRPRMRR